MVSRMIFVALLCLCAVAFGKQLGLNVEDGMKIHGVRHLTTYPGLFNAKWREIYDDKHLERQPKFKMALQQPKKELNYEIRDYETAWFVSSYTPCLNQTQSAADGYLRLSSYVSGNNRQMRRFPLTYPILSKIELGVEDVATEVDEVIVKPDKREQINKIIRGLHETTVNPTKQARKTNKEVKHVRKTCVDQFSQVFYLPIETNVLPPTTSDITIETELIQAKRYYVRVYHDEFSESSQAKCNLEAGKFALSLALSGVRIIPSSYYCAMYEPGNADVTARFEVSFEAADIIA